MRSAPSLVALLLAAISLGLACLPPSAAASASSESDDTCAAASSFYCPNCGGYKVTSCLDCDGFLSTDSLDDICFARRLFQPKNEDTTDHQNHYHYLWNDLAATVVWFITAGIAMACGVGGGGIYVPLGILLLQFAPKAASGLSQASIFGASLGGILLNARNRHTNTQIRHDAAEDPSPAGELAHQRTLTKEQEASYAAQGGVYYTRPLIHYDMALFLSPMEMAGAILGVLIQKILPNWLYLLLAALVLGLTARKTFKKYVSSAAKEKMTREAAAKQAMADNNDNEGGSADESPTTQLEDGKDVVAKPLDETAQEKQALELRKQYLEEDMCQFPKSKILSLIILWIGLLLLTLMKGGKGVESIVGITCESPVFAVLIVLQFLWMFGFAIVYGQLAYRNQAKRVAVQYAFLPGDPIWDMDALKTYGAFTFLAGVVAGLIGIGGGMVLGPLMLVMGVDPRVSSATTATMIVLTSSSVAVIFVTSGLVPISYALYFFTVCLAGALVGKSLIDGYVKKTGRASLLVLILATIIGLATTGCLVILITRLADADWCFEGLHKFCDVEEDDDACLVDRMLADYVR